MKCRNVPLAVVMSIVHSVRIKLKHKPSMRIREIIQVRTGPKETKGKTLEKNAKLLVASSRGYGKREEIPIL